MRRLHHRPELRGGLVEKILAELPLQVDGLLDLFTSQVGIERQDPVGGEIILGQSRDSASFVPRADHVGRAAELGRHDAQVGSWPGEIRTSCPFASRERRDKIQQSLVAKLTVQVLHAFGSLQIDFEVDPVFRTTIRGQEESALCGFDGYTRRRWKARWF